MIKTVELVLSPSEGHNHQKQVEAASSILGVIEGRITSLRLLKRSIDARSKEPRIRISAEVYIDEAPPVQPDFQKLFHFNRDVSKAKHAFIIGCGPAGMFAALRLIELGIKPIIIERGKDVRNRRRDLAAINKEGIVNPNSNYCFGEGGAGTYSDGKLYTRSSKRGDIQRILNIFISHGADESIAIDAHPHIGTNKLPKIVETMRGTILKAGGEILFNTALNDFIIDKNKIKGIVTETLPGNKSDEMDGGAVILATGHSARDIFYLLQRKNILIEAKPFALGVRVEHPQQIIDSVQYHCDVRSPYLPPASYALSNQVNGRGVYSFCMCPGGIIAPAATDGNEIVVNGWSPSKRNNPFANSGMVVSIDEKDFSVYSKEGALAALHYQMSVEQKAFAKGKGDLKAPAQRLIDFVKTKQSTDLPGNSYIPGLTSVILDEVLPKEVSAALRESLKSFQKKMPSYYTNEAVLVATESRTSSPVRIPRDKDSLQHPQVQGLYPCGEGAGYAGGIVSAAMDGERCAEAIALNLEHL
jgi:uncharacterized FAD-dependent dehydrogenase